MKVYIVKTYFDMENNFNGIDDTSIYLFDSFEKAVELFEKRFIDTIKDCFNENECDLNIDKDDKFFHINNDIDYITCKIEEKEVL